MRIDIPQDVPHRREIAPDAPGTADRNAPKERESHPILRRLKALSERASEHRLNHEPPRRTRSAPQHKEQQVPARHEVKDPREAPDTRRTQRNHIPTQTIGMQLRPEERKTMLELGRFRIIRTDDLADNVYSGKRRTLREDLSYLRSKGLVTTRHINLRRDGKRRHIDRVEVATLTKDGRAWLRNGRFTAGVLTAMTATLAGAGVQLALTQRLQLVIGYLRNICAPSHEGRLRVLYREQNTELLR
jgi:DNA-binding transcriptional ArsR family regulator